MLDLVQRGRQKRSGQASDATLRSWRAEARGHLYFLMERDDTGERTLIKADQLALEVFWRAPDFVRQHIVGRRDEARLPTTIQYHLDHLTVVTDDFDDRITLGQGDEVRSVIHPLAPGSGSTYDFLLGDSLSVTFPGRGEEIRVYEVRVRPRDPDQPGVVGRVFLDRESAAVVRMGLTFTPASYVDPLLDHIRLTLDNGLWEGRYWLPYRQELEIRRELPYLDLPAGTVIRVRYDVGPYTLNPELPRSFFAGPTVRTRPDEVLAEYDFDEGLYAHVDEGGLVPTPDLDDVREQARQMVVDQRLSGLSPVRLFAPSASAVLRHDRAEGIRLGAGLTFEPRDDLAADLRAGYALEREKPDAAVEITGGEIHPGTGIRAFWNDLRDMGPVAGASGAVSTLSSLTLDEDYRDPWFASGLHLFHRFGGPPSPGGANVRVRARYEEHEAPRFVLDEPVASFRPLPPVEEGRLLALDLDLRTSVAESFSVETGLTLARIEDSGWLEARGAVGWSRAWLAHDVEVDTRLQGGILSPEAPPQTLYRLGGRGTVPGFPYRGFGGDAYWLVRVAGSWGFGAPWIRPRILVSAGSTWDTGTRTATELPIPPAEDPRLSVGAGVGLFWDILRVDVSRGLDGGAWEWVLSVNEEFWGFL
ncbi:MAG: hypothetical protein R3223_06950 [Longimicrobiales bacterium]|nr:hypothetical protein [Longimicrobiales bacterium]